MSTEQVRRIALLLIACSASLAFGELHGLSSHAGLPPDVPSPSAGAASCDDGGNTCPLRNVADAASTDPPTYQAIEFVCERGEVLTIPFQRLNALALNPQRTMCVAQWGLYQSIIEGRGLYPIYLQLEEHRIGYLRADSLANGEALDLGVVPLARLAFRPPPSATLPSLDLVPIDDAGMELPEITRVRVVLDLPFHWGRHGEYVADS